MFYMHPVTPWTPDPPAFELQIQTPARDREVSDLQDFLVVPPSAPGPTVRTDGGFFRRWRWITRAYRSPDTPLNFDEAVNPGKENNSRIDLGFFMVGVYPNVNLFSPPTESRNTCMNAMVFTELNTGFLHTIPRRPFLINTNIDNRIPINLQQTMEVSPLFMNVCRRVK